MLAFTKLLYSVQLIRERRARRLKWKTFINHIPCGKRRWEVSAQVGPAKRLLSSRMTSFCLSPRLHLANRQQRRHPTDVIDVLWTSKVCPAWIRWPPILTAVATNPGRPLQLPWNPHSDQEDSDGCTGKVVYTIN